MEALRPFLQLLYGACGWLLARQELPRGVAWGLAGLALAVILLRLLQGKSVCRQGCLYQIAVPQGAEVMPFAAEQMFAALHDVQEAGWRRLWSGLEHISLEIAAGRSGIRFYLWVPRRIADTTVRLVHSAYEEADIRLLEQDYLLGAAEDALGLPQQFPGIRCRGSRAAAARMVLQREIAYPIKTLREFEKTDPLASITAAMADLEEGEGMVVQLLLQPGGRWELGRRARALIARVERGRSTLQPSPGGRQALRVIRDYTPEEKQRVTAIGGKEAKLPFRVALRLLAIAPAPRQAYARLRGLAAAYGQFSIATLNGWRRRNVWFARRTLYLRHVQERAFPLWGQRKLHRPLVGEHDVLTIEELSSLWHLPHPGVVETPGIVWSFSRKRAATPTSEGESAGLGIARTTYRGQRRDIVLPLRALFRHAAVTGLPGMGKSTLLARITLECINRGIGVVLLDPHGDLCEDLLPRIPRSAHDRVIYFNPAEDLDRPMGLNFLEAEPGQHPAQVKSEVTTMLVHLFGDQMIGPRSAYVLANCIQTLQQLGGMSILEIVNLLTDEAFRAAAIRRVRTPAVRTFWEKFYEEAAGKSPRLRLDTISPVLNKIGAFASDPRLAHVVGQAQSSFRVREVLDEGKALICNLSQGGLGLDNARLLGGAIASRVIQAAMARERIPPQERRPAVFIADEVHIFVGPAFPAALAQVRKYKLGLVLACQMVAQLEAIQGLRSAALSAGTLCVFKAAAEDGERLATELTGYFPAADLVRMDPYQVIIRIAGEHETIPFSGETIPLEESSSYDLEAGRELQALCREAYGRPVAGVEEEIRRRSWGPMTASPVEGLPAIPLALAGTPMEEQDVAGYAG